MFMSITCLVQAPVLRRTKIERERAANDEKHLLVYNEFKFKYNQSDHMKPQWARARLDHDGLKTEQRQIDDIRIPCRRVFSISSATVSTQTAKVDIRTR